MEREDIGPKLHRVVSEAEVGRGDYVLDVGTGTGIIIPYILEATGVDGRVLAVDISWEMLLAASAKGFSKSVGFLQADIEYTGLPDEEFDRVICNAAFPHFTDRGHALQEMVRMLKPGGTLVISHPIGREAVNNLHRSAGEAVAEDNVPTPEKMRVLMESVGLTDIRVIDELEFYLAFGRK